jgi:signal transduction histidine kinase
VEPLHAGIHSQTGVSLAELPTDSPQRKGVEEIEEAAHSANALTSALSSVTRYGRVDIHRVHVGELLQEIEHTLRGALKPGVLLELAVAVPAGEDLPTVRGDARQLRDMLLELVTNASESLAGRDDGRVRVTTGIASVDAELLSRAYLGKDKTPGTYVYLEVSDDGSGMGDETLSKIFVPFFTTRPGHRGLGLATVLNAVRTHGGILTLESEDGLGSTFRALFPAG